MNTEISDNDQKGRDIVITVLSSNNFEGLYASEEQFSSWDISCVSQSSKRLGIEVKYRTIPSTKYNDTFCEEVKVQNNAKLKDEGVFDGVLLMSVYTDGIIKFVSLTNPHRVEKRWCPETTDFGRVKYILKDCAIFEDYKTIKYKGE